MCYTKGFDVQIRYRQGFLCSPITPESLVLHWVGWWRPRVLEDRRLGLIHIFDFIHDLRACICIPFPVFSYDFIILLFSYVYLVYVPVYIYIRFHFCSVTLMISFDYVPHDKIYFCTILCYFSILCFLSRHHLASTLSKSDLAKCEFSYISGPLQMGLCSEGWPAP